MLKKLKWLFVACLCLMINFLVWQHWHFIKSNNWRSAQETKQNFLDYLKGEPSGFASVDLSACYKTLQAKGLAFRILNDGPKGQHTACTTEGAVRFSRVGQVHLSNNVTLSCPAALAFTNWVQNDLIPGAKDLLSAELARINHVGTYNCRTIAGSQRLSQHAFANAIDISSFKLKNGNRISVLHHWDENSKRARFLKEAGKTACEHFNLTLSPDYNEAHKDHFHLDMGNYRRCRVDG